MENIIYHDKLEIFDTPIEELLDALHHVETLVNLAIEREQWNDVAELTAWKKQQLGPALRLKIQEERDRVVTKVEICVPCD